MERRISSIQAHINAVEWHVNAVKHLQHSQASLRRARQMLRLEKQFVSRQLTSKGYFDMLEELPLPAYLVNREESSIIAANSQFSGVIGYPSEQLSGMPLVEVLNNDFVPLAQKALRKEPPENPVEWGYKRSDGTDVSLVIKLRRISLFCNGRKLNNVAYVTVIRSEGEVWFNATQLFG